MEDPVELDSCPTLWNDSRRRVIVLCCGVVRVVCVWVGGVRCLCLECFRHAFVVNTQASNVRQDSWPTWFVRDDSQG